MKNNFKTSILTLLAFLLGVGIYAQTVNGTVESDDGPLPGATVQVKGTDIGTSTDFDGNYSIQASSGDVLIVSFVGFATQEITVANQDQINVILALDSELEEVVVTGYGSQRSKEVTAAVVKVDAEDFNQGNISDAAHLVFFSVCQLDLFSLIVYF